MNRFVSLPNEPLIGANEVVVEVPHDMVAALALEFSLLLSNLATALRLGAKHGASILISVGHGTSVSKATVRRQRLDTISFELGRNQAEYLLAALLHAYRDGVAEVNHLHIEGIEGSGLFDLTVMFERYREPMSGSDATKLMNE